MAALSALDLVTTPVPLLGSLGLTVDVGVSGDDPLAERHADEVFRLLLSLHADGRLVERLELDPVGPGQRRLVPVSALAAERGIDGDGLAVVHRVPTSVAPFGSDPDVEVAAELVEQYDMYRAMVQLSMPGCGAGGVIYETPPRLNVTAGRSRPATALMFTSKVVLGPGVRTVVVALNHSLEPAWSTAVPVRAELLDAAGATVGRGEVTVPPFGVSVLEVRDLLDGPAPTTWQNFSMAAWSTGGALVFLVVQLGDSHVAVEHTHPPQAYLLPDAQAVRYRIKDEAIAAWDRRFEAAR